MSLMPDVDGTGSGSLLDSILSTLLAQMVKNPPAKWETQVQYMSREDPLEEGMAIHSSVLAWEIPWTLEPGGLQSKGS